MKNQSFPNRLRYASAGIRAAFRNESSFRTQCVFAFGAGILLLYSKPKAIWWALVSLTIAAVLSAELINSSLESMADRLHPDHHPLIAKAKDCAAGAVLVLSIASLGIVGALLWDTFKSG